MLTDWIWVFEKRRSSDILMFFICATYWMMVPLMEWERPGEQAWEAGVGGGSQGFGF